MVKVDKEKMLEPKEYIQKKANTMVTEFQYIA